MYNKKKKFLVRERDNRHVPGVYGKKKCPVKKEKPRERLFEGSDEGFPQR